MRLSAVILTKNAGRTLSRCLESVDFADEIVVFDAGSTDNTAELARAAGARLLVSADWPGFGPQRQRAQAHARGCWILWIDADEVVTPELKAQILAALEDRDPAVVYRVNRLTCFFGRFIRYSGWHPDRIVRLYRRDEFTYDDALVHEKVRCAGARIKDLQGHLLHYTTEEFSSYLEKDARYVDAWAADRSRQGRTASLFSACMHGMAAFLRHFLLRRGFLDGAHGFLLAAISGSYTFNKYAALWLKRRTAAR